MNKAELVDTVASDAGVEKRQAESVLEAFFDTVKAETKSGGQVRWPGFGSFSTTRRAARKGRNPQTGEPVKIKASTVMRFSPSSALKEVLNSRGGVKRTARKATAGQASTRGGAGSRRPATKAAAKKAPAKKAPATKSAAKKAPAKRSTTARKR